MVQGVLFIRLIYPGTYFYHLPYLSLKQLSALTHCHSSHIVGVWWKSLISINKAPVKPNQLLDMCEPLTKVRALLLWYVVIKQQMLNKILHLYCKLNVRIYGRLWSWVYLLRCCCLYFYFFFCKRFKNF